MHYVWKTSLQTALKLRRYDKGVGDGKAITHCYCKVKVYDVGGNVTICARPAVKTVN